MCPRRYPPLGHVVVACVAADGKRVQGGTPPPTLHPSCFSFPTAHSRMKLLAIGGSGVHLGLSVAERVYSIDAYAAWGMGATAATLALMCHILLWIDSTTVLKRPRVGTHGHLMSFLDGMRGAPSWIGAVALIVLWPALGFLCGTLEWSTLAFAFEHDTNLYVGWAFAGWIAWSCRREAKAAKRTKQR
jgi:hypothetical protein